MSAYKNSQKHKALEQPRDERLVEPAAFVFAIGLLLSLVGEEGFLLTVDNVLASVKVGLMGLDHLGLLGELVTENEREVNGNALQSRLVTTFLKLDMCATYEVSSDEILVVKVTVGFSVPCEDIKVLGQSDQAAEEQGDD